MPHLAAGLGQRDALRPADLLTCQDYTNGYYGVMEHVARDDSIDFVLHLGDFIYETAGDPRFQSLPFADRALILPSGSTAAMGLADYRHLYRSYRSDKSLQTALANHTWIMVPDDHETSNDCYWDYARDTLGAPDHPLTKDAKYGNDPLLLRQLKLDSQRAWAEYVPARVKVNQLATHPHDFLQIYRKFSFGSLIDLFMTENRTYRSAHPCGEGDVLERYVPVGCSNMGNPQQTMLGTKQRDWLLNGVTQSRAQWKLMGNQTYMGRLAATFLGNQLAPLDVDAWDGYTDERQQLADALRGNRVENFVVMTGDLHTYIASYVKADYADSLPWHVDNYLGVEFMTPSVTSSNLLDSLSTKATTLAEQQALAQALSDAAIRLNNPHIRYFNSTQHGYSVLDVNNSYTEWTAYAVDKNASDPNTGKQCVSRYRKDPHLPWLIAMPTSL